MALGQPGAGQGCPQPDGLSQPLAVGGGQGGQGKSPGSPGTLHPALRQRLG